MSQLIIISAGKMGHVILTGPTSQNKNPFQNIVIIDSSTKTKNKSEV